MERGLLRTMLAKKKPKEEKKVKNRPEKTGYKKELAVRAKQPGRGGEITGR